jgi:hypothetical protein
VKVAYAILLAQLNGGILAGAPLGTPSWKPPY